MNKAATIIAFIAGAAIGSVATWQFVKREYESRIEAEVEERVSSVKEAFAKRMEKLNATEKIESTDDKEGESSPEAGYSADKPTIMEYAAELAKLRYTSDSEVEESEVIPTVVTSDVPVVIPPDEFGEEEDYAKISLTYYTDDILTDESDKIIENVDELIGLESLSHFGEFEDDSVFVRNDERKCYFEILADERKYSDVIQKYPYKADEY